jgi:acyl dehydratase
VSGVTTDPSRYYEDLAVGERFVSQGRTITQTEHVMWSMFTGDLNPIHVDEHFAASAGIFGRTVPQGLLVVALASGLQERLGILRSTGRAMLSQTITYRSPAFVGDTIWVELVVAGKTARPGGDSGRVVFDLRILKHPDAKTVAEGTLTVLVAHAPDAQ